MIQTKQPIAGKSAPATAREWISVLAQYRSINTARSSFELAVTVVPFIALWALAWWSLSISYWLAFGLSVLNAAFLLRLFIIQHDCGHGAFLENKTASTWIGRALGVLTVTPFDVWKRTHSEHHSASGNLNRRGMGDIETLTVAEFQARNWFGRLKYRAYRHPVTLFVLGPSYIFLLTNRLPFGLMNQTKYWVSAMGTNAAIILLLLVIWYFGGLLPILLIFLPSTILAATAGIWLFYVQHQFETTLWEEEKNWTVHEAALHGSSHYVMPSVLRWFTGNIGIHHVHHLYSRIPFYRLSEVIQDHKDLAGFNRMTILESFKNAQLHLWDEQSKRLLSFRQARLAYQTSV